MNPVPIAILHAGITEPFPPVDTALDEPAGLVAAGGDLSSERLLDAYRHGIFPWYSHGQPILWWSPDPRTVFATDKIHISTRLHRWLRHCDWTLRADTAFVEVVRACAAPRATQAGTWITPEMLDAYARLHALGHAHSVEVYAGSALIGGIYGVALGHMFFGESMFSRITNGSKVALIALCRVLHDWGFPLLDAQVASPHLVSMGAFEIPRAEFVTSVRQLCAIPATATSWSGIWPSMTPLNLA